MRPVNTGTLNGKEPEGIYFLKGVRHVQFSGGAVDFSLDFSPCGVWGLFPSTDWATNVDAHVYRRGDEYVFATLTPEARYGCRVCTKIVVRAGINELDDMHPIIASDYRDPFPALQRVQFTPGKAVGGFVRSRAIPGLDRDFRAWQKQLFDAEEGLGWLDRVSGEVVTPREGHPLGPLFSGGIKGAGAATFRIDHPDGKVLVSVLLSGAEGPVTASVRANDTVRSDLHVEANSRRTVILPAAVREEHIDVTLDGSRWMLSGIVVQLILSEQEDFLFERPWWAFGHAPWKWPQFEGKESWQQWPDGAFEQSRWGDVVREQGTD